MLRAVFSYSFVALVFICRLVSYIFVFIRCIRIYSQISILHFRRLVSRFLWKTFRIVIILIRCFLPYFLRSVFSLLLSFSGRHILSIQKNLLSRAFRRNFQGYMKKKHIITTSKKQSPIPVRNKAL